MKNKNSYLNSFVLLFIILFCCIFQTVVYGAFSSTMKISGDAYARVEADIRITGFKLSSVANNTISYYEEYSKDTITASVGFTKAGKDKLVYLIDVTNYGNVNMGIYDITGLPAELSYKIGDYKLKETICDTSGKCNSMAKKTIKLEITANTAGEYEFTLNFDFRVMHSVRYVDITQDNKYPTAVIDGGDLVIEFKENLKSVAIMSNDIELAFYNEVTNKQKITISNIIGDVEVIIKKTAKLVNGSIDTVGSEVCIKDECFYIIGNDGSTVKMLSKYNLHVGWEYYSST